MFQNILRESDWWTFVNDYIVNTKEMFAHAYKNHYAIGAFNINHMELIQAAVETAGILKSAVIVQASSFTAAYADLGYFVAITNHAAKLAQVPVALHLDHGESFDVAKNFIDAGFTSVMIDGSHLPYEDNIKLTKEVCEYAHKRGVTVEGELGRIAGIEDGVHSAEHLFTDPKQALDFVNQTDVDSLAIAIGTSHGAYKFKPGQEPQLRFDILEQIEEIIPGFPIVLHGASSVNQDDIKTINEFGGNIKAAVGIPEPMLKQAASMAVCKVNMDTDLRLAMTAAVRETLANQPEVIDTRKYIGAGREQVAKRIAYKMEAVLGSAKQYV